MSETDAPVPTATPSISAEPTTSQAPTDFPTMSSVPSMSNQPVTVIEIQGRLPTAEPQLEIVEASTPLPTTEPRLEILQVPPNDLCRDADEIPVSNAILRFGNTEGATPGNNFGCAEAGKGLVTGQSGTVWYTALGNGNEYTVTTCFPQSTVNTSMQVLQGQCGTLACVAGSNTDRACNNPAASAVTFFSEEGVRYFFLVFGRTEEDAGPFLLTLKQRKRVVIDGF